MRILNWVQSKIAGGKQHERKQHERKQHERKPDVVYPTPHAPYHAAPETQKEEFSDWPHGLLAIGTFGNRTAAKGGHYPALPQRESSGNISAMEQDLKNFTVEEVTNLQKQLENILVGRNGEQPADAIKDVGTVISSLNGELDDDEDYDNGDDDYGDDNDNYDEQRETNSSRISLSGSCNGRSISKGEMFRGNNIPNVAAINHKSISFLCRKMFACRGGFAGIPTGLRDPLPKSILEKILKIILHKKIYPQSHTTPVLTRKYSEDGRKNVGSGTGEKIIMSKPKQEDGSKWVKTDSEFIVLEI